MKRLTIILLFLGSVSLCSTYAQTLAEIQEQRPVVAEHKPKAVYKVARENKNELQFVLSGMFLFYKNFISSQDGISCVFSPSCSEYTLLAIKKQGLLKGGANAFDRMTRCHALSPEKYKKIPDSPLLLDEL